MIPHRFHDQRSGRPIDARTINQALDEVRRLAISRPGPGFGGLGAPGGLLTRLASTGDMMATTGPDGIPAKTTTGGTSGTAPVTTLGKAEVSPCGIVMDDDGNVTTTTDPTTITAYNNSKNPVAGNADVLLRRYYGLVWIVIWEDCPTTDDGGS